MRHESMFSRLVSQTHEPESETGCWLWKGTVDAKGYGRVSVRIPGKRSPTGVRVHRALEDILRGHNEFDLDDDPFGPIFYIERPKLCPDEETIDHLCRNTSCINPDHLEVVSRSENSKRRNDYWRNYGA